jgi:hypothetical protein
MTRTQHPAQLFVSTAAMSKLHRAVPAVQRGCIHPRRPEQGLLLGWRGDCSNVTVTGDLHFSGTTLRLQASTPDATLVGCILLASRKLNRQLLSLAKGD